jgi:replicative DNA helicase
MLASRLQIIVVVLAQLNREIEKRKTFTPIMSDIKETGQLEQDADVIVFGVWPHRINSENDPSKYQFFVAKNRNRAINQSAIECVFEPSRQKLLLSGAKQSKNYDESFDNF